MHGSNYVSLSRTEVTDVALEQLEDMLHDIPQLEELFLDDTQITDAGLKHLKGLSALRRLQLDGTQVRDAGLEHLKGLARLQHLTLHKTQVTDAGVQKLQQALPHCAIYR